MIDTPPTVTFRTPLTALIAVYGLAVCVTPVAFAAPGLLLLYLLPVAATVWLLRTRTIAGPDALVVQRVHATRSLSWADLEGLRVDGRAQVWAVLHSGEEVRLPVVRPRDLPELAAASRGRLPSLAG